MASVVPLSLSLTTVPVPVPVPSLSAVMLSLEDCRPLTAFELLVEALYTLSIATTRKGRRMDQLVSQQYALLTSGLLGPPSLPIGAITATATSGTAAAKVRARALTTLTALTATARDTRDDSKSSFMDRFFCSVFGKKPVADYLKSTISKDAHAALLQEILQAACLYDPLKYRKIVLMGSATSTLLEREPKLQEHANKMAFLVVLEVMDSIAQNLKELYNNSTTSNKQHGYKKRPASNFNTNTNTNSMQLRVSLPQFQDDNSSNHQNNSYQRYNSGSTGAVTLVNLTLPDESDFTKSQLYNIRPGTIVEINLHSLTNTKNVSILACIVNNTTSRHIERNQGFSVAVHSQYLTQILVANGIATVTPLVTWLAHVRQLETCYHLLRGRRKISFERSYLGLVQTHQNKQQQQQPPKQQHLPKQQQQQQQQQQQCKHKPAVSPDFTLDSDSDSSLDSSSLDSSSFDSDSSLDSDTSLSSSDSDASVSSSDSDSSLSSSDSDSSLDSDSSSDSSSLNSDSSSDSDSSLDDEENDDKLESLYHALAKQRNWQMPHLNTKQRQAALEFIASKKGKLLVVQGPPGTGKTTFLVSTICRALLTPFPTPKQEVQEEQTEAEIIGREYSWYCNYGVIHSDFVDHNNGDKDDLSYGDDDPDQCSISEDTVDIHKLLPRQRTTVDYHDNAPVMVAAPTNKAVAVLASRFMQVVQNGCQDLKIVLLGEADKLMESERDNSCDHEALSLCSDEEPTTGDQASLQSIYLYGFVSNLKAELKSLQTILSQGNPEKQAFNSSTLLRLLNQFGDVADLASQNAKTNAHMLRTALKTINKLPKTSQKKTLLELVGKVLEHVSKLSSNTSAVHRKLVKNSHIILCTLAAAGSSVFKPRNTHNDPLIRRLAALFVDEAAAATEPELAIPFHFQPDRLLVAGDPQQLPASVGSELARARGLETSLHERLMNIAGYPYIMLDEQYRMKPEILAFPSQHFYQGRLRNSLNVESLEFSSIPSPIFIDDRYADKPFLFQEVRGREERVNGGSYRNHEEANAVVQLMRKLRESSGTDPSWCHSDRIRILTFYTAQVALINQKLRAANMERLRATTVDSSQGSEANLVVLSLVRNCRSGSQSAGFLVDNRRINVSLTRSKYQLICLGNVGNMLQNEELSTLHQLALFAKNRDCIVRQDFNLPTSSRKVSENKENHNNVKSSNANQSTNNKRRKRKKNLKAQACNSSKRLKVI